MITGSAFACGDFTWMKWMSRPSISVRNCGKRVQPRLEPARSRSRWPSSGRAPGSSPAARPAMMSPTVSFSGHRVAWIRRRRSSNSDSATSTWNGRMDASVISVPLFGRPRHATFRVFPLKLFPSPAICTRMRRKSTGQHRPVILVRTRQRGRSLTRMRTHAGLPSRARPRPLHPDDPRGPAHLAPDAEGEAEAARDSRRPGHRGRADRRSGRRRIHPAPHLPPEEPGRSGTGALLAARRRLRARQPRAGRAHAASPSPASSASR